LVPSKGKSHAQKKPQVKRLEALSWFVEGVFLDFTLLPVSQWWATNKKTLPTLPG
jgi:alpha-glucosidase (family GH31 glycosyl hydrolase)